MDDEAVPRLDLLVRRGDVRVVDAAAAVVDQDRAEPDLQRVECGGCCKYR